MLPTSYYIKTFGCQMNESDSERIAGFLEMQKIKPAKNINNADLVIFNTCGVRQSAENRVYGQIHNLRTWSMEHGTKCKIILTGCLANRKDVQRRLKNKVDLFCSIKDFPYVIASVAKQSRSNIDKLTSTGLPRRSADGTPRNDKYLCIIPKYSNPHTAYVPIMTGCNNFCSYCVVPYARGREVSRPVENIIKEIKSLVKNSCKEITLLGQNVNSYSYKKIKFPVLLDKLAKIILA